MVGTSVEIQNRCSLYVRHNVFGRSYVVCSHDALSPIRKEELYTFLSGVGSHHERGSRGLHFQLGQNAIK